MNSQLVYFVPEPTHSPPTHTPTIPSLSTPHTLSPPHALPHSLPHHTHSLHPPPLLHSLLHTLLHATNTQNTSRPLTFYPPYPKYHSFPAKSTRFFFVVLPHRFDHTPSFFFSPSPPSPPSPPSLSPSTPSSPPPHSPPPPSIPIHLKILTVRRTGPKRKVENKRKEPHPFSRKLHSPVTWRRKIE